jgi:Domain of unknown function (DUF6901)
MTQDINLDEFIWFRYRISFENGREREFLVKLDKDTLDIVAEEKEGLPDWTKLAHHKCPNCELDEEEHERCPVAVNLIELIEFFADDKSFLEADVTIESNHRNYHKRSSLQSVASSLMGIYMVTSGCPVLNKMRPMVETHLPFASWEETTYRIISMYLMAQHFLHKDDKKADWDLSELVEFFNDVYLVNNAFFQRLDSIKHEEGDTSQNAVSILNATVNITAMSIEAGDLKHWEDLFLAHWGKK